jgi:hypothetical protein
MNLKLSAEEQRPTALGVGEYSTHWLAIATWLIIFALCILKFFYLSADFPNYSPWMEDQAKFTDEGWWASAAVMHHLDGHWNVIGDYNPAVAVPVWPILLGALFHFTGVSVVAARSLSVTFCIATLVVIFLLVRRFTHSKNAMPAMLAVLLLSASPFAFVFSRLAILDTLVIFEFCLLMMIASYASAKRIWPFFALPVLITVMILTKTTAGVLVPAIFWMAWNGKDRRLASLLRVFLIVGVIPAVLLKGYAMFVSALGYGLDYHYFFRINALPKIVWSQTAATFLDFLRNGFWVDRILYPVGLIILVVSVAWLRKLWRNPLFAACWIALCAQACYIFRRQDDYAPRYFLVMLAPLVLVIVLTYVELNMRLKKTAAVLLLATIVSAAANIVMTAQFVAHPQYQFRDAAASIRRIITRDPKQKQLILGVSGSQISLMTGIPSINDFYGTENLAEKVSRYQPGWYMVWNGMDDDNLAMLSSYQFTEAASYPVFDDDDRNRLILYKMTRLTSDVPIQTPSGTQRASAP